ncbi:hypothetical protein [Rhodococcus sp. 5G237]
MNLPARIESTPNRIWDHNWNLICDIPNGALQDSEEGAVILELTHPAAQFLVNNPEQPKHLTVDSAQGRWSGRLREFTIRNRTMVKCQFKAFDEQYLGWTHLQCPDCGEVLYSGIWIPHYDQEDLQRAHKLVCEGEA